jgi:hypothetical protein
MRRIFVFNGDADGLCALQQLRLAESDEPAGFITGPKRRTELVKEVGVEDARNLEVAAAFTLPRRARGRGRYLFHRSERPILHWRRDDPPALPRECGRGASSAARCIEIVGGR